MYSRIGKIAKKRINKRRENLKRNCVRYKKKAEYMEIVLFFVVVLAFFFIALSWSQKAIAPGINIKQAPENKAEKIAYFSPERKIESKTMEIKICGSVEKRGWNYEASYWIRYAYELSDCDKNFIIMINAENAQWNYKRKAIGAEPSWGFCQIHKGYHPKIVNDPRFFTSQKWQLEQCLKLWRDGTAFYGWLDISRRNASAKNIFFDQ